MTDLHPLRMMVNVFSRSEADFNCEKGLDMPEAMARIRQLGEIWPVPLAVSEMA